MRYSLPQSSRSQVYWQCLRDTQVVTRAVEFLDPSCGYAWRASASAIIRVRPQANKRMLLEGRRIHHGGFLHVTVGSSFCSVRPPATR